MYDWRELVLLPDRVLARLDIAAVNLACGAGLPGCDRIDAERCLRTIDDLARRCGWEEEHGLQLVLKNGLKVNKLGGYDGHLTNSDAFDDESLEHVIYPER